MIRGLAIMLCLCWCESVFAAATNNLPAHPRAETLARACSGCHDSEKSLIPHLDGMPRGKFIAAMRDFKSGKRPSSIMNRIAKGYDEVDFAAMAEFFERR